MIRQDKIWQDVITFERDWVLILKLSLAYLSIKDKG